MQHRYLFLTLILFIGLTSLAQESEDSDEANLVVNGSFEEANTAKLKKLGQLDYATGWTTATEEKADLFSKMAEYPEVGAPKNSMGTSNPKDGDNYAGIAIHLVASKDGREYITSALKDYLKKGQKYCLSYSISLADVSKYATNNLGFHFSKKPVFEDKDVILRDDVVLPLDNKVQSVGDNWIDLCTSFTAKGYENYISIGNFTSESRLVTDKIRLPLDSKINQENMAYYYIDDISLVPINNDSECTCEDDDEPEGPRIIFSKSSALNERASVEDRVKASTIYFYSNESDLASASKNDLDALAAILMENEKLRILVKGHMDSFEVEKGKEYDTFLDLSKDRAEQVKQYLVDKGVSSYRITLESFKDEQPATPMKTPLSLAKNRRVQFELK